jgi:hypothetical protein
MTLGMITEPRLSLSNWIVALPPRPITTKTATKLDIFWEVNGTDIELTTGDYLVIPSGTVTAVKKVMSANLIVQSIKFPSIPDDKILVE